MTVSTKLTQATEGRLYHGPRMWKMLTKEFTIRYPLCPVIVSLSPFFSSNRIS